MITKLYQINVKRYQIGQNALGEEYYRSGTFLRYAYNVSSCNSVMQNQLMLVDNQMNRINRLVITDDLSFEWNLGFCNERGFGTWSEWTVFTRCSVEMKYICLRNSFT